MSASAHPKSSDLWAKIQSTRYVLLTTAATDGSLETRPMCIQRIDETGAILFFGVRRSSLVTSLEMRAEVNIGVANLDDDFYVSIVGEARISEGRVPMGELWTPLAGVGFPGGVEDEDLVLIEVIASEAEYWDAHEGEMVQFFSMAMPAGTGVVPTVPGGHRTLRFGGMTQPSAMR